MRHLLLLLFLAAGSADAYQWTRFTEADGLPGNRVLDLMETPDGALWAAGDNGVSRFDGDSWTHLATGSVRQLAFDGDNVWANSGDALPRWFALDGSEMPTPALWADQYGGDEFLWVDIAPRGQGEMWVFWERRAGSGGLVNRDLMRWAPAAVGKDFVLFAGNLDRPTAFVSDGAGECWIGTSDAIRHTDLSSGQLLTDYSAAPASPRVSALLPLGAGRALASLALPVDLLVVEGGVAVDVPAPPGGFLSQFTDAAFDARGDIWVVAQAEGQRILRYAPMGDPSSWPVEVVGEDGFLSSGINALLPRTTDSGTEVWFASEPGVQRRQTQNWEVFDTSNGLLAGPGGPLCSSGAQECNGVTELAVAPDGTLWVGGIVGLSRRTPDGVWAGWGTDLFSGIFSPFHAPYIRSLELDADGTLWVATDPNLMPAQAGGVQYRRATDPDDLWHSLGKLTDDPRWHVRDITHDAGGALWMAARDGIWRHEFSPTDSVSTHFGAAEGAFDDPAAALAADADWVFAAADSNRLARYDRAGGNWTTWDLLDAFGGPAVLPQTMLLSDGVLFLGTDKGLMRIPADATDLSTAQILDPDPSIGFASFISDLAEERDGFLLVATNIGLYRLATDFSSWVFFDTDQGLVHPNLSAVASEGEFIWAGTGGAGAMRHRLQPPRTRIVDGPEPILTYRETLYVEVEAIDPDGPEAEVVFDWRVDGGPWSQPWSSRQISFIPSDLGLSDGVHLLEIRATDRDLLREPQAASTFFELDSQPPIPLVASPRPADAVAGVVEIRGTADDIRFAATRLRAWPSANGEAAAIELLPWSQSPIVDGLLASWDTGGVADDHWTLELEIRDRLGVTGTARVEVLVDNEFPFAEQTSPVQLRASMGASVFAVDGSARVDLPPFALRRDGEVSVERLSNAEAEGNRSVLVGAGQARFDKTATLFIQRVGSAKAPAQIARRDGSTWVPLGGSESGGFLAVGIDGPGEYAVRPAESVSGGSMISRMATEPRHLRPRSGIGGDRMNISFRLGRAADVHAIVYSRSGRPRRVLLDGRPFGAGDQTVSWDGRDADGELVAAGLYIVCIEAGGERVTRTVQIGRD